MKAALLFAAMLAIAAPAAAGDARGAAAERPGEIWPDIRESLYGELPVADGAGMIALDAPYRAHDAAIVPVAVRVDPGPARRVAKLTLIVDENPAPVAAEFEIGPGLGRIVELSTRLRVNAYSNVRAVAELDDGSLYQFARFVKASGGCAAPAVKDPEAALATLGRMKLRQFAAAKDDAADDAGGPRREAQVMIRHPNNTGFQLDPVTQLYIPAFFLHEIAVSQGESLVFRMTGGISLSEDPSIRFAYVPNGAGSLTVRAADTDGGEFRRAFALDGGA